MQTKFLIIGVVLLEIIFLSWTSFVEQLNIELAYLDGENLYLEEELIEEEEPLNISSSVALSVATKENALKEREETYDIESNFLDLKGRDLTSLSMLPLEDENETQIVANILDKVTHLDASNNYLSKFPVYFLQMKNLKEVFLGNNNIKQISSNGKSESINTLDLSNNELSSYSTFALNLPKLQYLNLSGNYNLKRISIQRGEFSDLKEMNIKYTKLAEDSKRIAELYKLLPSDVKIIY